MRILKSLMILFFLMQMFFQAIAEDKIKIASIFSKTGAAAVGNRAMIDGIRFAITELNQQGGLLGRKIEIIEYDNHSSALHSKKAAEEAVKQRVVAVFGANWSSHSLAMAPVLQNAGIIMISPFSTNPDVTKIGDYIFRICFIDDFQGKVMANFAHGDLKTSKAAVLINASGRYSDGLVEYFQQHFTNRGGEIVIKLNYLQDTEDFNAYLNQIIPKKPDVIYIPGNIIDSALFIKQARQAGLTVPILGGDGWGDAMYAYAGKDLIGTYYSGHWHKDYESKKSKQFVKRYTKAFGNIEMDSGALAHDTVFVYANAVKRANSFNPGKVKEALATTNNFQGVTGSISFNQNGDPIKPGVIMKFKGGKSTYVKSELPN